MDSRAEVTLPWSKSDFHRIFSTGFESSEQKMLSTSIVDQVVGTLRDFLPEPESRLLWIPGCDSWKRYKESSNWYSMVLKQFPCAIDSIVSDVMLIIPMWRSSHYTLAFMSCDVHGQTVFQHIDSFKSAYEIVRYTRAGVASEIFEHVISLIDCIDHIETYTDRTTLGKATAIKAWAESFQKPLDIGAVQVLHKGAQVNGYDCGVIVLTWIAMYVLHPSPDHNVRMNFLPNAEEITKNNIGRRLISQILLDEMDTIQSTWSSVLGRNSWKI